MIIKKSIIKCCILILIITMNTVTAGESKSSNNLHHLKNVNIFKTNSEPLHKSSSRRLRQWITMDHTG